MELSVIIVNYNVKHFLDQCLQSVYSSTGSFEYEVIVVDNASYDSSCMLVKQQFPQVQLIENTQNLGFAKANNQAIKLAKGKYILLLNPDTVVQEDTLLNCLDFMESHPEAGSVTVKMIDGKGNYLPESKRGFPTPWVSFYKIFGLASLFPTSKKFARYYLGHLDKNQTHEIDILPGAFMFIRHDALKKVGLLDEQFFMYGEDIDLSYRITQGGYKNFYYPKCQIIHYKGESTKKGSINYVIVFYKAMILFAKKHISSNARIFIFLINIAIYFKAFLSILKRLVSRIWLPLLDIALLATSFMLIIPYWQFRQFNSLEYYPKHYVQILIPLYIGIWIFSMWLAGAYNKPQKKIAASKGIAIGTVVILTIYSILPFEMRFSRAVIIIGSAAALITTQGNRWLLSAFIDNIIRWSIANKRVAIVGNPSEADRINEFLTALGINHSFIERYPPCNLLDSDNMVNANNLEGFIRFNSIDEIIFCSKDMQMSSIIKTILLLSPLDIEFKIASPDSSAIIGSNSINTRGDLYTLDFKTISTQSNRRNKRAFDIIASASILMTLPIWLLVNKQPSILISNCLATISGKKTWIGYSQQSPSNELPKLRSGVYACAPPSAKSSLCEIDHNMYYAKNYNVTMDFKFLWQHLTDK